jgi:hypothetical protein
MSAEEFTAPFTRKRGMVTGQLVLWLVPAAFYYAFLLTAGVSGLLSPASHGLTFNSMLLHLLQGRFDVDPAAIGDEGYLRDGAVYAYFGILPALFRSLFLWLPNFAQTDLTRTGCLAAVSVMAFFKVTAIQLLWRQADGRASRALLLMMTIAILASGAQIQFLQPTVYQEVMLWADAFAAAFVYLVLRGLVLEAGFTPRLMSWMALAAGLALLTRVSTALGLYLSIGFVWLCVAWSAFQAGRLRAQILALAMPLVVLAVFIAVTGLVNAERWGNPLVFVDLQRALILDQYPGRLAWQGRYGQFNLERIAYGLGYYFAPFWVLRDASGQLLWPGFEDGFSSCCTELPPSSFFISDPLLIGLGVYGVVSTLREGTRRRALVVAAALGLAVPALLMLTFCSMTFRYRMEFYPLFELLAFIGFGRLVSHSSNRGPLLVGVATFAGVVTAHVAWVFHVLSPLGPAGKVMGSLSIVEFYRNLFQ